jgi:hypothetical protein
MLGKTYARHMIVRRLVAPAVLLMVACGGTSPATAPAESPVVPSRAAHDALAFVATDCKDYPHRNAETPATCVADLVIAMTELDKLHGCTVAITLANAARASLRDETAGKSTAFDGYLRTLTRGFDRC